jgi:hypothetical protein
MGAIRDNPEFSRPGYYCPGSTFSLVIIIGEMGIYATDLKKLGFLAGAEE